jgi:hypothetical protein
MKRAIRYVLNAVAVLSTMMCMATTVLWVRSHRTHDALTYWSSQDYRWAGVVSYRGCIECYHLRVPGGWDTDGLRFTAAPPSSFDQYTNWTAYGLEPLWRWGHFGLASAPINSPILTTRNGFFSCVGWSLLLPDWLVASTFAALAVVLYTVRRRRCRLPGHCPSCDYDLRATPDRCPECGAVPIARHKCRRKETKTLRSKKEVK